MEAEKRIPTSSAAAAKSEFTIDYLDDDSLAIIFNKLPYRDRVGIESVCKRWRDVSEANWGTYSKRLIIDDDTDSCPPLGYGTRKKNKNILEKILKRRGRYLEEIIISRGIDNFCQSFEVGTIKRIIECCPKLKRLNTGIQKLNADDWFACSKLEALSVIGDQNVDGLSELFRRNKRLRRLEIRICHNQAYDFDHLDPGQLEILHIICCPDFILTAELADKLAESLVELNYKTFLRVTRGLSQFSKLRNLRSLILKIKSRRLKTRFIVNIAKNCQKLERITLHIFVSDEYNLNFIPLLFNLPCLKSLVLILDKYKIPYEELDRLFRKASNLKFFVLSSCAKCTYEEDNVNPCDQHLQSLVIHTVNDIIINAFLMYKGNSMKIHVPAHDIY